MQPLVSVIIPVYNVADYLGACLESVCQQTYTNLEIILIDDGSTDGSLDRVRDLVQKDARIKVISQSNQGLSAARNAGLDQSTGDYVTFVDSDDRLYPRAISDLYQALVKHQLSVAIGSVFWENHGHLIFEEEVLNMVDLVELQASRLHVTIKNISCAKLYARYLFEGIRFPVGKIHEDEYVTYKIYLAAGSAVTIPQLVYHYVDRPGSITNLPFSLKNAEVLDAFREKHQILKAYGLSGQGTLRQYQNYTRLIWRFGIINKDQELCRFARKAYWYGFGQLTLEDKLGVVKSYLRLWLRALLAYLKERNR